jgi:FkbM family methyltransferase
MIKIQDLRGAIRYLTKVRGLTFSDELKLLYAITRAGADYITSSIKKRETSQPIVRYLPGMIWIRTWDGYILPIRPNALDLYAAVDGEYYELQHWFIPNAKGVVVDIGAYTGFYTIRACKQADLVISLEPQPDLFEYLKQVVRINCPEHGKNVILLNKAAGESFGRGFIKIPIRKGILEGDVASILPLEDLKIILPRYQIAEYIFTKEIEIEPLDHILESLKIKKVQYIKIDVEGAEAQVTQGAKETLSRTKYVMIELRRSSLWILKELEKKGFKVLDKKFYGEDRINYFLVNRDS